MIKPPKLTPEQFEQAYYARCILPKQGMLPNKDVLFDVLVNGMTYRECAAKHERSWQSVQKTTRNFMRFLKEDFQNDENDNIPEGYEKETFLLPKPLMDEVKKLINDRQKDTES